MVHIYKLTFSQSFFYDRPRPCRSATPHSTAGAASPEPAVALAGGAASAAGDAAEPPGEGGEAARSEPAAGAHAASPELVVAAAVGPAVEQAPWPG